MKIKLFYPAFDPGAVEQRRDITKAHLFQGTYYSFDGPLLNGLVSKRVALLDFDPVTGALVPGPEVLPPKRGQKLHRLDVQERDLIAHPKNATSIQALCFGAVMRCIYLVERSLGRDIDWAFDGDQLLVVPRAGYQPNAFYQRSSHSLQFFFVPTGGPSEGGDLDGVFTALSPDIVAHETAHALVDAIAPSLHDAASPESLALHEAIADVTAFIVSVRAPKFLRYVVERHGDADNLKAAYLGEIAEEIGKLRGTGSAAMSARGDGDEIRPSLRNLANTYALTASKGMQQVTSHEPHELSLVLSGALFSFFETMVDREKSEIVKAGRKPAEATAIAITMAASILTNVMYRALDYLPPGEISFADFGRAMLAADRIYMPGDGAESVRDLLAAELQRRGICDRDRLYPQDRARFPDLSEENLERFADESNDWQIYDFVRRFGRLFCQPDNTVFKVHDSKLFNEKTVHVLKETELAAAHEKAKTGLAASDDAIDDSGSDMVKTIIPELLIKVSWYAGDRLSMDDRSARDVDFRYGTTVSINLKDKTVLTRLTTNPDGFDEAYNMASQSRQRGLREMLIADWYRRGLLVASSSAGETFQQQPQMVAANGTYTLRNMAHMLHVADDSEAFLAEWLRDRQDEDGQHG
ncbi:MAG: hypothetical protein R3F54_32260 [Alphaproteobacteria bacterium]